MPSYHDQGQGQHNFAEERRRRIDHVNGIEEERFETHSHGQIRFAQGRAFALGYFLLPIRLVCRAVSFCHAFFYFIARVCS